jgi:hypothetical protein
MNMINRKDFIRFTARKGDYRIDLLWDENLSIKIYLPPKNRRKNVVEAYKLIKSITTDIIGKSEYDKFIGCSKRCEIETEDRLTQHAPGFSYSTMFRNDGYTPYEMTVVVKKAPDTIRKDVIEKYDLKGTPRNQATCLTTHPS